MNKASAVEATMKTSLRTEALDRRNALSDDARTAASEEIARRAGVLLRKLRPDTATFYREIGSECGTDSLMRSASASGVHLGLPAIVNDRIVFRQYSPGDMLVAGTFGTSEPSADAPIVVPDLIVLPLLAFDRSGNRLGYGRGHYDRAITALRESGQSPALLGVAFSIQDVETIPAEPHDVRLDWIVTESETLSFLVK